jgi:hypothetical protein
MYVCEQRVCVCAVYVYVLYITPLPAQLLYHMTDGVALCHQAITECVQSEHVTRHQAMSLFKRNTELLNEVKLGTD